jgi:hypothetical protein
LVARASIAVASTAEPSIEEVSIVEQPYAVEWQ